MNKPQSKNRFKPFEKIKAEKAYEYIIYTDASLEKRAYIVEDAVSGREESRSVSSLCDKTVNEAEYIAIIHAVKHAVRKELDVILIRSDSQLVINQILGKYEIKEKRLLQLHNNLIDAIPQRMTIHFQWVPREENLAGIWIDNGCKF